MNAELVRIDAVKGLTLLAFVVVEAEVSSLKDLKSANPTIIAVRYDKMGSPKQEPELVEI